MPDDDEDRPEYRIPLQDLTGKHGYALARNEEDDTPPEPGAPVAYVAEPLKERPNTLTIEGMIQGIGDAAYGAAREGGASAWTLRAVLFAMVGPVVFAVIVWVWSRL